MDNSMNATVSVGPIGAPSGVRSITDPRVDRRLPAAAEVEVPFYEPGL